MIQKNFVFQQVEILRRARAGTREDVISTGGQHRFTEHGVIHTGGRRYTGGAAEREQEVLDMDF